MQQFRRVAGEQHGKLRANGGAERRGRHAGHAGVHVLGFRVYEHHEGVHDASELVRGWCGRRRQGVRHCGTDASAAAELTTRPEVEARPPSQPGERVRT